jgi:hydroxymethylglutaryl-CoA synthase
MDKPEHQVSPTLLKPARAVGFTGYGAYVPRYRIPAAEIARVWAGGKAALPIKEKSVPGMDEDVITMSIEAARNALARAEIHAHQLRAVWVGSESHPYAVKPTSTVVAEAIGAVPNTQAGDWEFACKAGTEAIVAAMGFVGSGMADYAMAIGMDTAQGRPGDALEYTAAAGGAAFIVGPAEGALVTINASYSYVTDTPDFWRRELQKYPEHGVRFTGEPAYFEHVTSAGKTMMEALGVTAKDYQWAVFHQPNTKFPKRAAKILGFTPEQIEPGLLVPVIGNTYSGSSIIGLTGVLDIASPGDRVLLVSFGSGAGSDAFDLTVNEALVARRDKALKTQDYIARRTEIDYATYARFRGKITMK